MLPPGEISANVNWEKYKKCAEKRGKMRKEKEGRRKLRGNLKLKEEKCKRGKNSSIFIAWGGVIIDIWGKGGNIFWGDQ
jgi:hypothetical protein